MSIGPDILMRLIEAFLCVGVAITSMEIVSIRQEYMDNGLLSWRIQRLSHGVIWDLSHKLKFDFILKYPTVLGIVFARLFSALWIIYSALNGYPTSVPLVILTLSTFLMLIRSPQGNDGSDQMATIILVAITLSELVGTQVSRSLGLFFIAAQASLAYGVSGFLKVPQLGWRNGSYVKEILSTSSFGNKVLLAFVEKHQLAAKALGLSIGLGDCVLCLGALLPPPLTAVIFCFGFVLHLGIAAILGLNTFFWSFVATFPATMWVSLSLYGYLLKK